MSAERFMRGLVKLISLLFAVQLNRSFHPSLYIEYVQSVSIVPLSCFRLQYIIIKRDSACLLHTVNSVILAATVQITVGVAPALNQEAKSRMLLQKARPV